MKGTLKTAPEYQEMLQCTFATVPWQQASQPSILEQSQLTTELVTDRPASRVSTSSESERPASRASNSSETNTVNCLERWDDKYVKLLISCYSDHKHLFGKGKTTKREIFGKIACSFNNQSDVMVTGDQCMRKWIKLESRFKEIEDHNNHTGNDKKTMKFYEELSECLGSDPKVTPAITLESAENEEVEHTDSDQESTDSTRVKGKRPPRKRKSHSSVSEMIVFMKEYTAKREKVEEEKVKLMREMQEEKKNFFSQFLEIMRNK